jgi:hypothetical protein
MGLTVFPAPSAASKTPVKFTLLSGTSYTVPAGVSTLLVTLYGGGGSSGRENGNNGNSGGTTTMTGATSAVGGHGGGAGSRNTDATASTGQGASAPGSWNNGSPFVGKGADSGGISSIINTTPGASIAYEIGAGGTVANAGAGGNGKIDIEYWV